MKYLSTLLTFGLLTGCVAALAPTPPKSGLDLSGFDRTVRPQDDLFHFAGGRWLAQTPIPPDLTSYNNFTALSEAAQNNLHQLLEDTIRAKPAAGSEERKAADFYASFMDTATIEARGLAPLQSELARIDALSSPADLVRYIGYNQTIGVGEPMAWGAPQDKGDTQHYITQIYQSGLTMPDRDYYLLDDAKHREYREKFTQYVGQLLQLAGSDAAESVADAQKVLALETALAAAHWTRVQNRDPVKTYNKMTLAQAAALAPQIDWNAFLQAAGAPADQLVITQPSYISALGQLLQSVPMADWRIYFRFRLLDNFAAFLPSSFDKLQFDFHQHTLAGAQEQRPRWKRALALMDGNIGEITGRLYVSRYFPPQNKARIRRLVGNLLSAYDRSIGQLDWMSEATRQQARRKLAKITVKVGYPDKWRDYSALQVSPDDLVGNVIRSAQFELHRQSSRMHGPVDRGEWDMTPQTVNAYYNPTMNEIVFPAAILQPPFFDVSADDAVNYGSIGAIIGHEISHGFDDQGRQFDADGNLRDWWTAQDAERFKAKTTALVAQYAAYTVLDGVHVNGQLTLGENIADNSGLAIAYKAYHIALQGRTAPVIDGFTGDQRFFLGWAQTWRGEYRDDRLRQLITTDPHSPTEYRADDPPSNNDAFYAAFDIKPGDRLYRAPAERVKIW